MSFEEIEEFIKEHPLVVLLIVVLAIVAFYGCNNVLSVYTEPFSNEPYESSEPFRHASSKEVQFIYSDDCGYCQQFKPIWKQVMAAFRSKNCAFSEWNAENKSTIAKMQKYKIQGYPTVLFFHQGRLVNKSEGFQPLEEFTQLVQEFLGQ